MPIGSWPRVMKVEPLLCGMSRPESPEVIAADLFTISTILSSVPDGATLASCGRLSARFWDFASGELLLDVGVGNTAPSLAFSHDGHTLAVATTAAHGEPGRVRVFKIENGRGIQTLRGLSGAIAQAWFSSDGKLLAVLAGNWRVAVWNTVTGQLLHVLDVPNGFFTDNADLAFSTDDQQLVFASGEHATLWNIANGRCETTWHLPPGLGDRIRFTPDGRLILLRFETRDGKLGPFNIANPSEHPRVCRFRDLLGATPTDPTSEITEFNQHVYVTAADRDGGTFVIDGVPQRTRDSRDAQ